MIKDTDKGKGTLMFGTETIVSEDGSMTALLGASPGASVCVDAMLEMLGRLSQKNSVHGKLRLKK